MLELQAHGSRRAEDLATTFEVSRRTIYRDVQALCAMYRPHMAREATDVFPTLRHLVTADEYAEIAEEMMKRERQAVGADGFEKVAKQVAEVEKVIGIQDIGVFTPKS